METLSKHELQLTADGCSLTAVPQITDFGLAKLVDSEETQTRSGAILGTRLYMAPEQAQGRLGEVGPATDVFSLGVILYEMLAGVPPFRGATDWETMRQIIAEEPARLRQFRPEVSGDVETICLKCLAKSPHKRYGSAGDLANDLRRFLAGEAIAARPAGVRERAAKWLRRRPGRAAAILVCCAAVAATPGVLAWLAAIDRDHQAELKVTKERERREGEEAARKEELAFRQRKERERHYFTTFHNAWDAWRNGRQHLAANLLNDLLPRGEEEDLRGFEWYLSQALVKSGQRSPNQWIVKGEDVSSLTLSPDGKLLAVGHKKGLISLWETETWQEKAKLPGHRPAAYGLAFSPDGKLLASAGATINSELKVWDVERKRLWAAHSEYPVTRVAFSPDGKVLAAAGEDLLFFSYEFPNGRPRLTHRANRDRHNSCRALVWPAGAKGPTTGDLYGRITSYDGKTAASVANFIVGEGTVAALTMTPDARGFAAGTKSGRIVFVHNDQPFKRLSPPIAPHIPTYSVVYSNDGKLLVSGRSDGYVFVWDTTAWNILDVFHAGSVLSERALVFMRSGRTLLCGTRDGVKIWDLSHWGVSRLLTRDLKEAWWVLFTPEGDVIAGGDDHTARVWDGHTGKQLAVLGHPTLVTAGALSRDGKVLATADHRGSIRIWHKMKNVWQEKHLLNAHKGPVRGLAVAPDGTMLASGGEDSTLRFWDIATGKQMKLLRHPDPIHSLAFDRKQQLLASGGTTLVNLWNFANGELHGTLAKSETTRSVVYSPDGSLLAIGTTDGVVNVRDVQKDRQVATLKAHTGDVRALAFSPDGTRLATGGEDKLIKLWHVATEKELLSLDWHKDTVSGLAFSPDGRTLASASHDGTVRLWLSGVRSGLVNGHDSPPRP